MIEFDVLCEQLEEMLTRRLINSELPTATTTIAQTAQAAVALILRQNLGAAELLLIKRAIRANDHWSGHLALPGGRWQRDDRDLLDTAIRETREEIGMDLSAGGRLLGRFETLKPQSPLAPQIEVTPFLFLAPVTFHIRGSNEEDALLALNHEVAAAFWVPVAYLKTTGLSDTVRFIYKGEERSWLAYPSAHGPIWGMTERMLTNFLKLMDGSEKTRDGPGLSDRLPDMG